MPVAPREQRTGSRRRLEAERGLLEAAEALLADGGTLTELSVEQITARAGRPRTAFYLYFQDKTELLMRMTESVAGQLYDEAERWWSGEDGRRDLRGALERILTTYRDHDDLLRVVVEAATYDERVSALWRSIVGRFITATTDRIEAEGESREAAAAKAFALVWMTERACYEQVAREGVQPDAALVDALVEIWERSVYA